MLQQPAMYSALFLIYTLSNYSTMHKRSLCKTAVYGRLINNSNIFG